MISIDRDRNRGICFYVVLSSKESPKEGRKMDIILAVILSVAVIVAIVVSFFQSRTEERKFAMRFHDGRYVLDSFSVRTEGYPIQVSYEFTISGDKYNIELSIRPSPDGLSYLFVRGKRAVLLLSSEHLKIVKRARRLWKAIALQ